ncbi:PREDICTED: Retrovirus-related Pol poly from [Prunus dulcis]|uniref:PREDICTED: Retrovirus-related Pol poly from n=1 Tax=Prunus dulcis TaxID=3755 RepID=A0A5E4E4T7_PRUDU|nr:PREDICTED: Retrovirus-related Pol poly from [Prunus dulcis]
MIEHRYRRTTSDHCVFVKRFDDGEFIILLLYVDDMLIVGQNSDKISKLKKELSKSFAMKDLGPAKQILGMSISRDRKNRKLRLSQESYIEKVLKRFNMDKAKPVSTPFPSHFKLSSKQSPTCEKEKENMAMVPYSSAVGSLMYAMICTRPDITHAVGVVSRFLSKPGREHWNAVKWILRYLRGTSKMSLCFGGGKPELIGYTDADMAGDLDSRKSTSGYLITFSRGAVSWQSKLQKCVALSTTEAEFIAATEACKEMLWMKRFLQELGQEQHKYILHCDSQSAIHLSKNPSFHSRSKHIDVRYHWIRDVLESKQLQLEKIHTDDNSSNMMTKSLPKDKYEFCRIAAGLLEPPT